MGLKYWGGGEKKWIKSEVERVKGVGFEVLGKGWYGGM